MQLVKMMGHPPFIRTFADSMDAWIIVGDEDRLPCVLHQDRLFDLMRRMQHNIHSP